jgi:hypothetical protein
MADDKVTIFGGRPVFGRAPAQGELLVGDGVGLILVDVGISEAAGVVTFSKPLEVDGTIESTTGGFVFPDGSTQTTAANNLSSTQIDFISGLIPALLDQDYRLVINLPYGLTALKTTTRCVSGTATATFKINASALGGSPNSVSSTMDEQAHSTSNIAAAGDDIVLSVASNASCLGFSFTIAFERTLA